MWEKKFTGGDILFIANWLRFPFPFPWYENVPECSLLKERNAEFRPIFSQFSVSLSVSGSVLKSTELCAKGKWEKGWGSRKEVGTFPGLS